MDKLLEFIATHPWIIYSILVLIGLLIVGLLSVLLLAYFRGDEIAIWQIKIARRTHAQNGSDKHSAQIYARHRDTAHDYFANAFKSGREVVWLTIMSQETLKQIDPNLRDIALHNTKLNVLTLDPDSSPAVIEAFRLYVKENEHDPSKTVRQVREAWDEWSTLSQKHPNLRVRKYKSAPIMQGLVVRDMYAYIELMPYSTRPRERPGLVITPEAQPEIFQQYQDRFFELWKDSQD